MKIPVWRHRVETKGGYTVDILSPSPTSTAYKSFISPGGYSFEEDHPYGYLELADSPDEQSEKEKQ